MKFFFIFIFIFYNLSAQINWQLANSGIGHRINDIVFIDSLTGFAAADNYSQGFIIRTNNGGYSWTISLNNFEQGIQRILYVNDLNLFAIGWYGKILKSTNLGITWIDISNSNPSKEPIFGGYFFNSQIGILIGGNGTVLRTINGGVDWSVQQISNQELWDIKFINNDVGFIISKGRPAKIFKTSNKGLTWTEIYTEEGYSEFYNMKFINSTTGYIVGGKEAGGGIILQTTNAGNSWQKLPVNSVEWLLDIDFSNENSGVAVGANGLTLITNNGGSNWLPQYLPTSLLKSVFITPINTLIGGDWGRIYYSSSTVIPIINILSPSGNETLQAGQSFNISWTSSSIDSIKILFSPDGGLNWNVIASSFAASIGSFNWKVPQLTSNLCKIKLQNISDTSVFALSPLFSISAPPTTNNKVSISLPQLTAKLGDTVLVPVSIIIPNNLKISSFEISLNLNPNLQYIGFQTLNTLVGNNNWAFNANLNNNIIYTGAAGANEISSSGVLFFLRFKIISTSVNNIPLNFNTAVINAGGISIELTNGNISLTNINISYGDVDLNGTVQTFDASLILKYIAGTVTLNQQQLLNADVNLDGIVNSLDASLIIQYVLKIIPSLPVQGNFIASGDLIMPNLNVPINSSIEIPVALNNSTNIKSFEGSLNYDLNKLEFEGLEWSPSLADFTKEVRLNNNLIIFAGAGSNSINSNGLFLKLKFKVKSNYLNGQTQVLLNKIRWNANSFIFNPTWSTISVASNLNENNEIIYSFSLNQNYPNPFNPQTRIDFSLAKSGHTILEVYDINGTLVETLINEYLPQGNHFRIFPNKVTDLPSGVYFYRLMSSDFISVKKMIYIK